MWYSAILTLCFFVLTVDVEEEDGEVEFESLGLAEGEAVSSVLLQMFVVQPKSLQDCRIAFKLDPKPPTLSNDTLGNS